MLERKWPDQTLEHYSDGLECREPSTDRISTSGQFRKRLLFGRSGFVGDQIQILEPQLALTEHAQGAQE